MEKTDSAPPARREIAHVEKSFVESILDNVLLGGFMVTGLIMLTTKYVPAQYTDFVAAAFILIPLLAWAYRFRMAQKRRDVGL
ncbi:MAG: hypothetical protein KGH63_00620 [Candidatus Micrarchaeota archaeon]|nr:hypothetical protein [Candidatus Micrarchaeota archaeon]